MDVLSQVLQQVRLAGAVLFRAELGAPWCISTRPGTVLAQKLGRPTMHVITFHVVLQGRMWARLGATDGQWVEAGQAVVLPHGDAHVLGDTPQGRPVPTSELWGEVPLAQLRDVRWGGDGGRTRVLCGFLGCQRDAFAPLFAALPSLFRVQLQQDDAAPALDPLLAYAEHEIVSSRAGSAELRLRMAELIFVEALRRYMEGMPEAGFGWLAGLRDPLVGRALVLLHDAPQRAWDVETLAHETASSRSHLAERFKQVLGEPPMQYLSRWRMLLATRRLRESRDSIAAVAEAVGYESPAAFQRAFKRHLGVTPARWRCGDDVDTVGEAVHWRPRPW